MYRQSRLFGCSLMAFAFGLLIGMWLEGGFFCICLGLGLMICGFSIVRKR